MALAHRYILTSLPRILNALPGSGLTIYPELFANSFRIRTYAKYARNSFRIRTYKFIRLKVL
jgi:hypothetical protein